MSSALDEAQDFDTADSHDEDQEEVHAAEHGSAHCPLASHSLAQVGRDHESVVRAHIHPRYRSIDAL